MSISVYAIKNTETGEFLSRHSIYGYGEKEKKSNKAMTFNSIKNAKIGLSNRVSNSERSKYKIVELREVEDGVD